MCAATAKCINCEADTGLRKLTPQAFICETCADAMGLEPAAQFFDEADWLQTVLEETGRELRKLAQSEGLTAEQHRMVQRASVFNGHARNRYAESLVLVRGA